MKERDEVLLSSQDVADLIGSSKRYVEEMRRRGGGPVFCKLSRRMCRYKYSAVMEWLSEHERTSTSDPGPDLR